MKVLKFGGTSVGSAESIQKVLDILSAYQKDNQQFAVVFSAVGGMTNKLIEMSQLAEQNDDSYVNVLRLFEETHYHIIRELIPVKEQSVVFANVKGTMNVLEDLLKGVYLVQELSNKTLDYILSHGERLNAYILTEAANHQGIDAAFLDARELVKTNNVYGGATVNFELTNTNIQTHFTNTTQTQFITGFIASDSKNVTTTLGRGGSDYTASIFAAALNAEEVEIWTDVDGVMTADPRKVKNAFSLSAISYKEAMELSHFGAKVIYPPTLQPVFVKNIPIRIRNTFNTAFEGTYISEKTGKNRLKVKGISSINEISLLTVQGAGIIGVTGVSSRLFTCLGNAKVNLILITQASSEHSISFAVSIEDTEKAKEAIENEFYYEIQANKIEPVRVQKDKAIVAIVGERMHHTPNISGKMFSALGKNGVNISAIAQGSSELNVSAVIQKKDVSKALNALHDSFFLSESMTLNVFMIGPGLIGGTLLKQIQEQKSYLLENKGVDIRVIAIANSRKMLFNEQGIDLSNWKDSLENDSEEMSFDTFFERIKELNLPYSVFVDNTSNKQIIDYYPVALDASVSIVTPNKVANSSSYTFYKELQDIAKKRGVKFLYETNVGAGLPVINTLQDLMNSGDDILRVEGVLSGSLSYIFNTYDGSTSFKEVVLQAKENGFTEPDPRDDLNGMDVARKILILARESGLKLEPEDVKVNNILPQACIDAPTVDAFFEELEKADSVFKGMIEEAQANNKKLCFIAQLEDEKATVSLQAVDANHPFYSLAGSDNMISYTTMRYKTNPLVIKGPGAGAEVTAAGVFADIITVSKELS
ncbi:MAG: bifunctional aspartate kinase/homoserine dehydrogenase I [Cytophagales bacterium]|nr:bifunctional aspartate kinase/homoserine dehydrogenase I [Cytophagales bacterium]